MRAWYEPVVLGAALADVRAVPPAVLRGHRWVDLDDLAAAEGKLGIVTLPLHYRYITVTLPSRGGRRARHCYITVTLPLHYLAAAEGELGRLSEPGQEVGEGESLVIVSRAIGP